MQNERPEPVDLGPILLDRTVPEIELPRLFRHDEELVICDIGACEGEDSIRYSRLFPRANVFAFEPLPDNQRILQHNFDKYGATRARLVPLALAEAPGKRTFYVSGGVPEEHFAGEDWNYGNKSSSILPPADESPMHGWIRFSKSIPVDCDTLDNWRAGLNIGRIDFIHMDAQGAEYFILQGARKTLPDIGALWLEVSTREFYQGQALSADIGKLLGENGFALLRDCPRSDGEGDQLWINRRYARNKLRLISSFAGRSLLRLKNTLRSRS